MCLHVIEENKKQEKRKEIGSMTVEGKCTKSKKKK